MIDKILIHIGYDKTGSTWFQQELFTSESDTFEPFSVKNKGRSTIAHYFYTSSDGYLLSSFDDNYSTIQKEINYILAIPEKDFQNKIPVISSERLSGNPHSSGFDSNVIAHRLKKTFSNAKIFIVIREQKSFLLSNYFQYIFGGGIFSLRKYLTTKYDGKRPFFSPGHINYLPLIKEYVQLFGRENVLVLPYEMFKEDPMLFITRLEFFLNVKIVIKENIFNTRWNKRDHFFIRYYFRFLNIFRRNTSMNTCFLFSNKYIEYFINLIIKILGRLTPRTLNMILLSKLNNTINDFVSNRYFASNKELDSLINIDLSKYGYYDIEIGRASCRERV